MARPLEDMARDLRPGLIQYEARSKPAANDNGVHAPRSSSALPSGALAIIEPTLIATIQSGRARRNQWRLRFAAQARPFVDPLTGWTGGSDPLAHVVLRFPSLETAELYCRLQQLRFEVRRPGGAPRSAPIATVKRVM
jgi:hypothetical protein